VLEQGVLLARTDRATSKGEQLRWPMLLLVSRALAAPAAHLVPSILLQAEDGLEPAFDGELIAQIGAQEARIHAPGRAPVIFAVPERWPLPGQAHRAMVPVLEGGALIGFSDGALSAIDATSGAARWSLPVPDDFGRCARPTQALAVAGVVVVTLVGCDGSPSALVSVDPQRSKILWRQDWGRGQLQAVNNWVVSRGGQARDPFEARDPKTGSLLWTHRVDGDLGDHGRAGTWVAEGTRIATSWEEAATEPQTVAVFDARDRRELYRGTIGQRFGQDFALARNLLIWPVIDEQRSIHLEAVDVVTKKTAWKSPAVAGPSYAYQVRAGTDAVYAVSFGGTLRAFDLASGAEIWRHGVWADYFSLELTPEGALVAVQQGTVRAFHLGDAPTVYETAVLSGRITHQGKPVEGAMVHAEEHAATTGADGRYSLQVRTAGGVLVWCATGQVSGIRRWVTLDGSGHYDVSLETDLKLPEPPFGRFP
jgi:outer membrane protein assembly factor BamB